MAEGWAAEPAGDNTATATAAPGWGADTNGTNGFGDAAEGSDEPPKQFEKKVNKKKLEELENFGKPLMIYVRVADGKARKGSVPLDIRGVYTEVAKICSDSVFEYLREHRGTYFELTIGEGEKLDGLRYVFNWIKQCGEQKSVVAIENVDDLVTPERGFQPLVELLKAANKLKVPHASFGKFLLLKAKNQARENLVSLDAIKQVYDTADQDRDDQGIYGLREVFAQSVFSHWYDFKLEEEEYDEYMAELQLMRENIKDLHEDIERAVQDKNDFIKSRRDKKRAEREAEAAGGDNGFGGGYENAFSGAANGWENQNTSAGEGGWDNAGAAASGAGNNWDQGASAGNEDSGGQGGDWADEMNHGQPVPAATGW